MNKELVRNAQVKACMWMLLWSLLDGLYVWQKDWFLVPFCSFFGIAWAVKLGICLYKESME